MTVIISTICFQSSDKKDFSHFVTFSQSFIYAPDSGGKGLDIWSESRMRCYPVKLPYLIKSTSEIVQWLRASHFLSLYNNNPILSSPLSPTIWEIRRNSQDIRLSIRRLQIRSLELHTHCALRNRAFSSLGNAHLTRHPTVVGL